MVLNILVFVSIWQLYFRLVIVRFLEFVYFFCGEINAASTVES